MLHNFQVPVDNTIKVIVITSSDLHLDNVVIIITVNIWLSLFQFSMQTSSICTRLIKFTSVLHLRVCLPSSGCFVLVYNRRVFVLVSYLTSSVSSSQCQVFSLLCVFPQLNMRNVSCMGHRQLFHLLLTYSPVMVSRKNLQVKHLCVILGNKFQDLFKFSCLQWMCL
jgi:hypothetical protein